MPEYQTMSVQELVDHIGGTIGKPSAAEWSEFNAELPQSAIAPYALIVGAGFSCGIVPMVRELMHTTIGDYYFPDQDQSSMRRSIRVSRRDSAAFWEELNTVAKRLGRNQVPVDARGLPSEPGSAYQTIFSYDLLNELFRPLAPKDTSGTGSPVCQRESPTVAREAGERFLRGFLRYTLDPGCEHGHGSTGRTFLNPAHIYLAALLEAQQLGRAGLFCRTVLTTNFDTLLQNALQMVNLLYTLCDEPEQLNLPREEESAISLIYLHGSILKHNPASSVAEVDGLAHRNSVPLQHYLSTRDVITIGYNGWKDCTMQALHALASGSQRLFWCDIKETPAPHIEATLRGWGARAAYVSLGSEGADGLMRALYARVVPNSQIDPSEIYRRWSVFRLGQPA